MVLIPTSVSGPFLYLFSSKIGIFHKFLYRTFWYSRNYTYFYFLKWRYKPRMVLKITNLHILRYLPTCWLYLLERYTIDNQRCTHTASANRHSVLEIRSWRLNVQENSHRWFGMTGKFDSEIGCADKYVFYRINHYNAENVIWYRIIIDYRYTQAQQKKIIARSEKNPSQESLQTCLKRLSWLGWNRQSPTAVIFF